MTVSTAEEKATSRIRSLGGRICPRCRHHEADLPSSPKVARCPNDGFALIDVELLAAADGDPFLGVTVAERFVILGRLGAGSMGTVYRARQEPMGREVAIKILRSDRAFDAQAKARFTREARAMSLLTSPHTVTVFDFGEIPEQGDEFSSGSASLYLAMELLSGEALGERLKRVRRLPVEDAARIARHALLSLAEAHEKGIVHRDLKPDNLFLTRAADGQEICKVLDFGIAKLTADHDNVDALETQAGTVFGTPRYMSPEQAQGKALDARSDLYSLGVLLYQMLVGRPPFVDEDAVVVMARHIKTTPVAPAVAARDVEIGDDLSRVVMRTLAKDPVDRPASAKQLIDDLDRALEQRRLEPSPGASAGAAREGSSGETPALVQEGLEEALSLSSRRTRRRARALWISVGALGAAVLAGVFTVGRSRGVPPPPLAQKELAEQVKKRLPVTIDTEAARVVSSAPPAPPAPPLASAEPPAPSVSASAAAPASSVKKTGSGKKPYKRFD